MQEERHEKAQCDTVYNVHNMYEYTNLYFFSNTVQRTRETDEAEGIKIKCQRLQ